MWVVGVGGHLASNFIVGVVVVALVPLNSNGQVIDYR